MISRARWRRLRGTARRQGMGAVALWIGHGLATRLTGIAVHRVLWLEADRMKAAELPAGLRCRFLEPEEVLRRAADPSNTLSLPLADRITRLGHRCLGAFDGERLIAHGWYATGVVPAADHWGIPMSLPPGVALSYLAFTHPEYRGRRIHAGLKARALTLLAPGGVRGMVSLVRFANWPSLSSLRRMGHEDLGLLVTQGWGGKRLLRVPREAERRGIRFESA